MRCKTIRARLLDQLGVTLPVYRPLGIGDVDDEVFPQLLDRLARHAALVNDIILHGPVLVANHAQRPEHILLPTGRQLAPANHTTSHSIRQGLPRANHPLGLGTISKESLAGADQLLHYLFLARGES